MSETVNQGCLNKTYKIIHKIIKNSLRRYKTKALKAFLLKLRARKSVALDPQSTVHRTDP